MTEYRAYSVKYVEKLETEIERLKSQNKWAKLDIAELIDDLGVHPLFWNGVHQACFNETNVPVQFFKTKQECHDWCDETNKSATETPTIEIASLKEKLHNALRNYGLPKPKDRGMQGLRDDPEDWREDESPH